VIPDHNEVYNYYLSRDLLSRNPPLRIVLHNQDLMEEILYLAMGPKALLIDFRKSEEPFPFARRSLPLRTFTSTLRVLPSVLASVLQDLSYLVKRNMTGKKSYLALSRSEVRKKW
jgi:hypothetical protein